MALGGTATWMDGGVTAASGGPDATGAWRRRPAVAPAVHLSDPVVEVALRHLTARVYSRKRIYAPDHFFCVRPLQGLQNPYHRTATIHLLKHLKYNYRPLESDEIRDWAVANGWSPEDAEQLAEYAAGVSAGKHYHTLPDPWGRWAFDRWRDEAGADEKQAP
jgi:hypothetical protein